ncbi:hypothetical protein C1O66_18460 [Paucibacter aquatile]|uniref:Protein kinase domain-containing protein n=1 Tax=Kinneretia aquatilis TaxID=2070761 RepID=A0A2N8L0U3_9BURK|nr:serine/threonine protein kinase [Paucibacter aquatile]PND39314.1 hypothetical protein C1O66_18460 [Paucibacter aquatile]
MAEIDKARWARLSPLLDELLDLAPEHRPARLQALHQQAELSPDLIEDLAELLRRQEALEAEDFLASPALSVAEAASTHNQAGQTVGAYTLEREIGQGGMGTVWLARRTDGRFEGQVAIKFLNTGLIGRGDAGRFAREGQILARLTHPHIARLIDAGVAPEHRQPYLVLEYIDGLPLDRFCVERGLDCEARVRLFLDVLAAVAHAHTRLILHRDLKPSNILVTAAGEVKLLDFGIAKLLHRAGDDDTTPPGAATELTRVAGRAYTPRYAAPEQVQGGEVTTATDVYALGVLLYLLLSGQHPTEGQDEALTTPLERLRTLVEVEPKKVSERVPSGVARQLRGDLDTIVAKALKKAPAERYANAAALAEDLQRWLAHEPISARPDRRAYIVGKFIRRHRLAVAASCTALLAIAAGAGAAVWKAQEAHEQRVQAEGLIEFMLGDLRKKLDPVGRLDVLDAVGEKALAYYAQQDLRRSDADALGRRARALHLMGEIAEKRGQMAEAEERFKQAADSTAELLARDAKNTQRLFDHAQSSYWVGYAAWRQGKQEAAENNFETYLQLAQTLTRSEPANSKWQTELAHAEVNLGVLLLNTQRVESALERFTRARTIWQVLIPAHADLQSELTKTWGWMARAQEKLGQFEASISSHEAKLQVLRAEKVLNRQAQDDEATTLSALSRLQLSIGQGSAALVTGRAARDAFVKLVAVDTDNLLFVERLAYARLHLIETVLALGSTEEAREELSALEPEYIRLLAATRDKPDTAIKIPGRFLAAQAQLATKERSLSPTAAPLRDLTRFVDRHSLTRSGGGRGKVDVNTQWALALASYRLGNAIANAAPTEARTRWNQALEHLAGIGESVSEARVKSLRAHALLSLGRTQEARSMAEGLEASGFRHPEWQVGLARRMAAEKVQQY